MEEAAAHGEPTLSSKAGSQATLRNGLLLTTRQATSSQSGEMSSDLGSPLSDGIPGSRTTVSKVESLPLTKESAPYVTQELYSLHTWLLSFNPFQKLTRLAW